MVILIIIIWDVNNKKNVLFIVLSFKIPGFRQCSFSLIDLSLFPILSTKSEEFQQFCLDLDKNNKYLSFAFKFGQNTTQGQIMSMDTYCVAENYMKFFTKQEQ